MSWLETLFWLWLWSFVVVPLPLYIGYGYVVSSVRARDLKDNPSPAWVVKMDVVIATPIILLDGYYNAFCMPFLCLDWRASMAFRKVTFKGVTFTFLELITERLSRYSENPNEWRLRRFIALTTAPALDAKDPKGWHIRKANNG